MTSFLSSVVGGREEKKKKPAAFINNKSRFTAVRNMAEQFFQLNSAQISLVVAGASLNRSAALYLLTAPALSLFPLTEALRLGKVESGGGGSIDPHRRCLLLHDSSVTYETKCNE